MGLSVVGFEVSHAAAVLDSLVRGANVSGGNIHASSRRKDSARPSDEMHTTLITVTMTLTHSGQEQIEMASTHLFSISQSSA